MSIGIVLDTLAVVLSMSMYVSLESRVKSRILVFVWLHVRCSVVNLQVESGVIYYEDQE